MDGSVSGNKVKGDKKCPFRFISDGHFLFWHRFDLYLYAQHMLLEIIADSVEAAQQAERGGADRLELITARTEGGLTPSTGLFQNVRRATDLPIFVMIRPRGGDFAYTQTELDVMHAELDWMKAQGADGLVLGCLQPDGRVQADAVAAFLERAYPLPVTFHRAFDACRDPEEALEDLIRLGVPRVLTSGWAPDVFSGREMLRQLQAQTQGRLQILAGGGVRPKNLTALATETGITEWHSSATKSYTGRMQFRHPHVTFSPDDHTHWCADATIVQAIKTALLRVALNPG